MSVIRRLIPYQAEIMGAFRAFAAAVELWHDSNIFDYNNISLANEMIIGNTKARHTPPPIDFSSRILRLP